MQGIQSAEDPGYQAMRGAGEPGYRGSGMQGIEGCPVCTRSGVQSKRGWGAG